MSVPLATLEQTAVDVKVGLMGRLFGTDGVRGRANRDITARLALQLSVAASRVLAKPEQAGNHRPRAIVGRDTRISGDFLQLPRGLLQPALTCGMQACSQHPVSLTR